MRITSLLTAFVVVCLFWGSLPTAAIVALAAAAAGTLIFFGHHSHGGVMTIDVIAHRSRLSAISPSFKVAVALVLLALCVCCHDPMPPVALFFVMMLITVAAGGVDLHDYLSLMALPAVFLLVSGVALLWDFAHEPVGVMNVKFFSGYLTVTTDAQTLTRLVMGRTLGALSCLYFMSLTTPMSEIMEVMRRARLPQAIGDLVILIYRYIFVLLSTYASMKNAAESRLGFVDYRTAMRTTGFIYGNLLAKSFRKADACMDAMDSRCYAGGIRFLEAPKPVTAAAAVTGIAVTAAMLGCVIYFW